LGNGDQHVQAAWAVPAATGTPRTPPDQRLGCSIVPVHFFDPQRHSQIFFRRAVWRSARVMP
jgi:hypothetical protein